MIFKAVSRMVLGVTPKASRPVRVAGEHINDGVLAMKMGRKCVFAGTNVSAQMTGD